MALPLSSALAVAVFSPSSTPSVPFTLHPSRPSTFTLRPQAPVRASTRRRRALPSLRATLTVGSSQHAAGADSESRKVLLEVRNLRAVVAESRKEILRGVNIIINEGEVHAIVGRNGSGKSTLSKILDAEGDMTRLILDTQEEVSLRLLADDDSLREGKILLQLGALSCGIASWFSSVQVAESSEGMKENMVYEIGELFELGIQLSYLLILLGLLGVGTFFVIRQVLVRRELDLSAKELQEQVRSGDASATEYFELGAVMLRRKFYPAAIKYLQQAIEKWDRDDQDLAQVYNALGVSYVRDKKLDKGIAQFENAVKLQPGYVTAWNNLGDAYEKKKDLRAALKAFEEVLLFDPNNRVARPRRDALRERVQLYKGIPLKSEDR